MAELNHHELKDCDKCGRVILKENIAATGFIAECGNRLMLLHQCKQEHKCTRTPTRNEVLEEAAKVADRESKELLLANDPPNIVCEHVAISIRALKTE